MTEAKGIRAGRAFVELFADGQIDGVALLAAVWAAAQTCFIRAGIANEVRKAQQ